MWCERCKDSIEPEHSYVNIQGDEWVRVNTCPYCGGAVYDEEKPCPLCDGYMSEHDTVCPYCKKTVARALSVALDEIKVDSDRLTALGVINDMWDDITEWARQEDRKDEEKRIQHTKEARRIIDSYFYR